MSSPDVKLAMLVLVEGELMPSGAKSPRDSSSMVDSGSPFAFDNLFIHTIIPVAHSLFIHLWLVGDCRPFQFQFQTLLLIVVDWCSVAVATVWTQGRIKR